AVAPAADVTFPKPRDDAAEVLPIAADVAAVAQVGRPCAGVAVEAPEHLGDVAIDIMEDRRRERPALWTRERDGRMHPLLTPALGALAEQGAVGRPAKGGAPPPAHQPPADIVIDRDQVPRRRRGRNGLP